MAIVTNDSIEKLSDEGLLKQLDICNKRRNDIIQELKNRGFERKIEWIKNDSDIIDNITEESDKKRQPKITLKKMGLKDNDTLEFVNKELEEKIIVVGSKVSYMGVYYTLGQLADFILKGNGTDNGDGKEDKSAMSFQKACCYFKYHDKLLSDLYSGALNKYISSN